MQNIFNKSKRKHDGSPDGEHRSSNHKKYKDSHVPENSFRRPYENANLIPLNNNSSDGGHKSHRIANLIRALDEALKEDGMDETLGIIGVDNVSRCLDLRSALKKKKLVLDTSSSKPQPQQMSMSHVFQNIPKPLSTFSISPWRSSTIPTTLPPLPKILDPTLEKCAFTHVGATPGRPTDLSYERLEWVGDAYLQIICTLLISQTFPSLMPGKATQIREKLVKNINLSKYSYEYGFDKRAILPKDWSNQGETERIKDMGDIFEAYVAAVVLSDPENGIVRAAEWLKELCGRTIAKDIIDEERHGYKIDSPMWRLRGTDESAQVAADAAALKMVNPKGQLQKMIGAKGVKIEYRDAAPEKKSAENKMPVFTVGIFLDGWGEKNKMLGSGKAMGKKEAGMKAAEMAMANKKLMKVYIEKKKIHDAQMELEKAELERQALALEKKE